MCDVRAVDGVGTIVLLYCLLLMRVVYVELVLLILFRVAGEVHLVYR